MKNIKTTLFGLATIATYALSHFFPAEAPFINGLVPLLVGAGLLAAKDHNVTGGTKEQ